MFYGLFIEPLLTKWHICCKYLLTYFQKNHSISHHTKKMIFEKKNQLQIENVWSPTEFHSNCSRFDSFPHNDLQINFCSVCTYISRLRVNYVVVIRYASTYNEDGILLTDWVRFTRRKKRQPKITRAIVLRGKNFDRAYYRNERTIRISFAL